MNAHNEKGRIRAEESAGAKEANGAHFVFRRVCDDAAVGARRRRVAGGHGDCRGRRGRA